MNGLDEILGCIKNFICEKRNVKEQIVEIEAKRTQLAQERNEKKKCNCDNTEIYQLGKAITELGNQSQELQNKLDFRFCEVKTQVNLSIDNFIAEGIRKIRKINEEIQELEEKNANKKERDAKYQLQKQEFYERFGRMPELSENAIKENEAQEKECEENLSKITELSTGIAEIEEEITRIATIKREFKNGNWNCILEIEHSTEELAIEPLTIEELDPIEEIYIEEFAPIEEIYVEEFTPIKELQVEEFKEVEEVNAQSIETIEVIQENNTVDEIEELAKAIIEEIVAQQTADLNVSKVEEKEPEDIIVFEKEPELEIEKNEKVKIPLFGPKAIISNIIVKIEEKQLVYKALMSDGEEIKIYPSKIGEENVLLRDKQNRAECEEILINYANSKCKEFDKKVVNKIDPLVCELLIECAEKYKYDAQNLIYNYSVSFLGKEEPETVPGIIYNISYLEGSSLSKKEKTIIRRICRNARRNDNIDIIETFTTFKKIKYIFKRLFAVNNVKVLPEAKY